MNREGISLKHNIFSKKFTHYKDGIIVKSYIRKYMKRNGITYNLLAKKTDVNVCKLIYLLSYPISSLQLLETLAVCKYLKLDINNLMEKR